MGIIQTRAAIKNPGRHSPEEELHRRLFHRVMRQVPHGGLHRIGEGAGPKDESRGDERPDRIGRKHGPPEPPRSEQALHAEPRHERHDSGDRVFGKELHPAVDHQQEAERVAEILDQRPPGLVGQMGAEHRLADHRKADQDAGRETGPDQRCDRPRQLFLAVSTHDLVDQSRRQPGRVVDRLLLGILFHRRDVIRTTVGIVIVARVAAMHAGGVGLGQSPVLPEKRVARNAQCRDLFPPPQGTGVLRATFTSGDNAAET